MWIIYLKYVLTYMDRKGSENGKNERIKEDREVIGRTTWQVPQHYPQSRIFLPVMAKLKPFPRST
jgi:hypothetical protein